MSKSMCYRAFEFRAAPSSDGKTLEGYAAVFDQTTEINSWEGVFEETIKRGAFAKTIKERMPVLQFDHGRDSRTGTVPIGAINVLREDKTGLYVEAGMFDNAVVEPIRQAIAGGAIDGMSFRFRIMRELWTDSKGKEIPASELSNLLWKPGDRGPLRRSVLEVECPELGPVVFPAYEGTSVGVRSLLAGLDEHEREALVRELAAELRLATNLSGAAAEPGTPEEEEQEPDAAPNGGTSGDEQEPDAGEVATSGMDAAARSRRLRLLPLRRTA